MSGVGRRRRRRTGRVLAVAAAVLAIGAGTAAAGGWFGLDLGLHGRDPQANTAGSAAPATAKVTRQTLVDTQKESGELGYGEATTVNGRGGGTVTALPATGSTVQRGQALYHVDNTPVVLLYGALPAYRALATGAKGADVKQFEQNLYALGYRGFTVDETYSATTAAAVKEWQDDLGLPKTGTVDLGRIVYAAGPVRVDSQKAALGDELQPGAAVLTYTGSSRVVVVKLDTSDQRLARKDAAVSLMLPDGKTATGKIVKTRTVVDTSGSGGGGGGGGGSQNPTTKIEVTVSIDDEKAVAGLDQATVDVGFTAAQRENVLTVPVAALLALAEGGYGVQVVDGASTKIVAVQTGLFASGRVEVSGDGLTEGMTVGMPS